MGKPKKQTSQPHHLENLKNKTNLDQPSSPTSYTGQEVNDFVTKQPDEKHLRMYADSAPTKQATSNKTAPTTTPSDADTQSVHPATPTAYRTPLSVGPKQPQRENK
ncbi:hypothetical protein CsSME_00049488 [Camellia sinensis var. sinensis]